MKNTSLIEMALHIDSVIKNILSDIFLEIFATFGFCWLDSMYVGSRSFISFTLSKYKKYTKNAS